MKTKDFKLKIGLEAHCQLTSLKTKLFCSCATDYRSKEPNTLVCPVCLGLPGSLPVLNKKAIEYAIMVSLALKSRIPNQTFFYRKNYYYPDLPKNFQITQYDGAGGIPFSVGGSVPLNNVNQIRIRRIQLEEDPAKLVHLGPIDKSPYTLVDYNRAGIALIEIVTEPDLKSPKEARLFLQRLRSILEHLGVSDGGLEGALRCDTNISLAGGERVEIKNISSFKEVERALRFEIMRQKATIAKGLKIAMETRHWDEDRRITISLRTKEAEHDYRYFPEQDLVPVVITKEQISEIEDKIPELPEIRKRRFIEQYGLPIYDASVLTDDKTLADFFEKCVELYPDTKKISNWMMSDLLKSLHWEKLELENAEITPKNLVDMIKLIDSDMISGKIGKKIISEMVRTGKSPLKIVKERGLIKISSYDEIVEFVDQVFNENPNAVKDAALDKKATHYLVGKLMEITEGRADPEIANQVINKRLRCLK